MLQRAFPPPVLVNVCSTARGGSTLLDLVLGNGPGTSSLGEVCAYYRPYRKHHFNPYCACGHNDCVLLSIANSIRPERLHAEMASRFNLDFIIDSSKELHWVLDNNRWALDSGLSVVNVLLWKEPVDLAYSFWKRGAEASLWRDYFVQYYGRAIDMGMPFVSINFNDFRSSPAKFGRMLADYIGMPWFEGKERFWESERHYFFGSSGTAAQVGSETGKIRDHEDLPRAFLDVAGEVVKACKEDNELCAILETLKTYDVSKGRYREANDPLWHSHPLKPLWYYKSRLWRFYKRFLPDKLEKLGRGEGV